MPLTYNKLDELTKQIEAAPTVELYLKRCVLYQQTGLYHEALNDCYSALEIDPDNAEAKSARRNDRGHIRLFLHRQTESVT